MRKIPMVRAILLLLGLLLPLAGQETMIRRVHDTKTDTHVEVTSLFSTPAASGFHPVRVKIANNLDRPQSIQLNFESASEYMNRLSARSSFSFTAEAGKNVTRDILVPVCPANSAPSSYNYVSLTATLSGTMGSESNSIRVQFQPDKPCVLLSETLFSPNASKLDAARSKSSGYGSCPFASRFNPKELPSDWLAFSGFDSVMMTDTDWSNTPAGARNAIISWMILGGQLVIHNQSPVTSASLGIPGDTGYGSILLQPIGSSLNLDDTDTLSIVDNKNPVKNRNTSSRTDYLASWPLQSAFGSQGFQYGLFIVVLVIFAIIVGPVNLFVLAKSTQRHRLFITTPIISLVTSLILIALIVFQDGFGGRGMRVSLMEVRSDAGINAAFVHQEQISRTGVLLGAGFTVDPACFLSPVPISNSPWSRFDDRKASGNFSLQPADGKMQAAGDWWKSRSEQAHTLSAVVPTRGRIERTASADQLVSTFDFPIQTLLVRDKSNQWFRAENITTGKTFTLTPVDASMAGTEIAQVANTFCERNRKMLERASNRTDDHFIAVTDHAPGIDTLPGIRWQGNRTVITGPLSKL